MTVKRKIEKEQMKRFWIAFKSKDTMQKKMRICPRKNWLQRTADEEITNSMTEALMSCKFTNDAVVVV